MWKETSRPRSRLPAVLTKGKVSALSLFAPFDRGQHFCGLMSRCLGYHIPFSCQRKCLSSLASVRQPTNPTKLHNCTAAQPCPLERPGSGRPSERQQGCVWLNSPCPTSHSLGGREDSQVGICIQGQTIWLVLASQFVVRIAL